MKLSDKALRRIGRELLDRKNKPVKSGKNPPSDSTQDTAPRSVRQHPRTRTRRAPVLPFRKQRR
jgi:hypothetical protein